MRLENVTIWLAQSQLAKLFQTSIPNVSMHIRNIFNENELHSDSVVKEFLTTAADGKKYQTRFYNLDVIIPVGYRVKSPRGTQLRIWATQRLREYSIKGLTLDDERLKQSGTKNHCYDAGLDCQAGRVPVRRRPGNPGARREHFRRRSETEGGTGV